MELRAGYKNTEIGVIPVEWEVIKIGDLTDIATGTTPPTNDRTNYGTDFLFVSPADLGEIKWIEKSEKKLSEKGFSISRKFPKNSILFTCIGSTIGKSGIATIGLTSNQQINALFPNDSYNTEFAYYELQIIAKEIKAQAGEQAVPMVNKSSFAEFKIPLPPLPEQTAIATVLSDTDQLLQALEKKIAKKRLIKKGAMQRLLSPKEGWVVKPLGKFVNFSNGKAHENHIDINGEYTVVNSKFVSTGGRVFKSATANFSPLKKGDIVMVMSDIPNGKALAKCFLIPKDNKYALNQRICSIRTEEADTKFLFYILNRNKYYLAFDSGTGQTNLKKEDVLNCPIPLPKTKEEQIQIATILSDMNIEIENLEKQLAKYKQVKQGLMQNLLTGKIRLV